MATIPTTRRISTEDYASEYSDLIEKLSYVLNSHMDDVTFAINGNLDFDNNTSNIITITLVLGADNKPVSIKQINVGINNPRGLQVISAVNLTNGQIFPTAQPFINYTNAGNGLINIENITGIPQGYKFQMTLIAY